MKLDISDPKEKARRDFVKARPNLSSRTVAWYARRAGLYPANAGLSNIAAHVRQLRYRSL